MSSQARKSKAEVGEVMTETKGWSDTGKGPGAKECKWPLQTEKSKEMDSPLRTSGRSADHLLTPFS